MFQVFTNIPVQIPSQVAQIVVPVQKVGLENTAYGTRCNYELLNLPDEQTIVGPQSIFVSAANVFLLLLLLLIRRKCSQRILWKKNSQWKCTL